MVGKSPEPFHPLTIESVLAVEAKHARQHVVRYIDSPTASGQPIAASRARQVRRRSRGEQCETASLVRAASARVLPRLAVTVARIDRGLDGLLLDGTILPVPRLGREQQTVSATIFSVHDDSQRPTRQGNAQFGRVLVARALGPCFWHYPPHQTIGFPLTLPPFRANNISGTGTGLQA